MDGKKRVLLLVAGLLVACGGWASPFVRHDSAKPMQASLCSRCSVRWAQTVVEGDVVNGRGETIEYVSIGLEADSVGTISDEKGHFVLTIPEGKQADLLFSHVSYLPERIPYDVYRGGCDSLVVVLKEKVVGLTEVVVGRGSRLKTIVGKGITVPGVVGMSGKGRPDSSEWGIAFQPMRDHVVSDVQVDVAGCDYLKCTLSMNLYELVGGEFVNVLTKPIYQNVYQSDGRQMLDFVPEENIVLKRKRKYFASISCVDTYGQTGVVYFQAQVRTCYFRHLPQGTTRKLPGGPVIVVRGYEVI